METELISADLCTGCGACRSVCPAGAAEMKENEEGFLFPCIDKSKCIKCGLCSRACPYNTPKEALVKEPDVYAAWADDEIRKQSSSGGVFSLIAGYILKNAGFVSGAVMDNETLSVNHIVSDNSDDISKMRASKYIQSCLNDCFEKIKQLLENNKPVLFTGTPCQCAGLKSFLGRNYKNLYIIDILCHSVPSGRVFRKFISGIIDKDSIIKEIDFRSKASIWAPEYLMTIKTDKKEYNITPDENYFYKGFFSGLISRKSCSKCIYSCLHREGDLTLGDFWHIKRQNKTLDDGLGTSLILVNNEKGAFLLNEIKKDLKLLKKMPLAAVTNLNLKKPSPKHKNRDLFFKNLDKLPLKDNIENCLYDKLDAAVINYWWAPSNYGAMLTGYALQQILKEAGINNKLIDNKYMNLKRKKDYEGTFNCRFSTMHIDSSEPLIKDEDYENLNLRTNTFITGSDQVFSPKWMKPHFDKYFLEFVSAESKKIAFSASFGVSKEQFLKDNPPCIISRMKNALKSFDFISVREKSGLEICRDVFGIEAEWIIDPVFIMDKSNYDELIKAADTDYENKIVSYILDREKKYDKAYKYLSEKYNMPVIETAQSGITAENWLASIKNCALFVTDSFHGMCFALIFNKPFICIANKKRGLSRFESICGMLDIKKQYIDSIEEIYEKDCIFEINYEALNSRIKEEALKGIEFLNKALNAPVKLTKEKYESRIKYLENKTLELERKTHPKEYLWQKWLIIYSNLPEPVQKIISSAWHAVKK